MIFLLRCLWTQIFPFRWIVAVDEGCPYSNMASSRLIMTTEIWFPSEAMFPSGVWTFVCHLWDKIQPIQVSNDISHEEVVSGEVSATQWRHWWLLPLRQMRVRARAEQCGGERERYLTSQTYGEGQRKGCAQCTWHTHPHPMFIYYLLFLLVKLSWFCV